MISNPFLLAMWFRNLYRLLFSNKPDYVHARAEMGHGWKANIEQPFMDGYNATSEEKAHWHAEREERNNNYGWIHVVFVLSALFFLFALLRFLWSIPALNGGN